MSNNCGCNNATNGFAYPYNRPARDSYEGYRPCPPPGIRPCPGCHPGPMPNPNHLPVSGPFQGNGFSLINTYPYLIDTTTVQYGSLVSYNNTVRTDITQRRDPSCINLSASIDLTTTDLNNTVLNDFLKKYISSKYAVLDGVLPIFKSHLLMKLYYTILDINGGVMYSSVATSTIDNIRFHYTDIRDMFVTSGQGIIIDNIRAMTYAGLYTLVIDKVEMYVPYINTHDYVEQGLNPFYQFTDNNMKITLQHDIIENTDITDWVLISETPINMQFEFQANITNRLRISYIAFMNNLIAAPDTIGIWEALNEPTDEIITQLRQEVSTLEETVNILTNKLNETNDRLAAVSAQCTMNLNTIQELNERLTAIEQRPLALTTYNEGKSLKAGQLTYPTFGVIYQCENDFVASNVEYDINKGNIVPISPNEADVSALMTRLNEMSADVTEATEKSAEAFDTATNLASVVETNTSSIETQTTQISNLESAYNDMVTNVEGNTSAISTNTEAIAGLDTRVTALENE